MGYYTTYTVEQIRTSVPDKDLKEYLTNSKLDYLTELFNSDYGTNGKWYDHDDDMVTLSANFPETIFKLHGEGEETGDIWDKYYTQGQLKCYVKAKIVLEEPDMKDW